MAIVDDHPAGTGKLPEACSTISQTILQMPGFSAFALRSTRLQGCMLVVNCCSLSSLVENIDVAIAGSTPLILPIFLKIVLTYHRYVQSYCVSTSSKKLVVKCLLSPLRFKLIKGFEENAVGNEE